MNPLTCGTTMTQPLGTPRRMILLGYYDGPTEGVIQFENGAVYWFVMPDEEAQLGRQWFPRDYTFHSLPSEDFDRLEGSLAEYLDPNGYVNWKFPTPELERVIEQRVANILAEAGPAAWLVKMPTLWSVENFHPTRVVALQAV